MQCNTRVRIAHTRDSTMTFVCRKNIYKCVRRKRKHRDRCIENVAPSHAAGSIGRTADSAWGVHVRALRPVEVEGEFVRALRVRRLESCRTVRAVAYPDAQVAIAAASRQLAAAAEAIDMGGALLRFRGAFLVYVANRPD